MNIIVTGGAGFIGSAMVRYLINDTDHNVINVDCLTYAGNLSNVASVSFIDRYQFEQVNICDRAEVVRVFNQYQPDAIIHLAAESHVDRSIQEPSDFIQTNVMGTYHLLEAAYCYWNRLSHDKKHAFKFIHVSTDEVFGDLSYTDKPFNENSPYAPSSPYSASKASSDHLVKSWFKTYDFPTIVTNCSNNYGPYHYPEKLIPLTIINALQGKDLPVYGSGQQIRDWLYVDDHIEALYLVLMKGKAGQSYTIGGNNEKKNIDVVEMICGQLEVLAFNNSYSYASGGEGFKSLIKHVDDRLGHDKRYAIDTSKMSSELSWTPKEKFESGLRKTIQWYLDNEKWYQEILLYERKFNTEKVS